MTVVNVELVGGFGNRLFILAFVYAYSKKWGIPFNICVSDNKHEKDTRLFIVDRFRELENYSEVCEFQYALWEENEFLVTNFPKIQYNMKICGYFQNMEYFSEYRNDILHLFRKQEELIIDDYSDYMFIHIRLGDYINNPSHYFDLTKYLDRCLSFNTCKYLLFTDSPNMVYNLYPALKRDDITLVEKSDTITDFYKMIACSKGVYAVIVVFLYLHHG